MYSSRVQRSSHGPSERLMKYCRHGEPLGRPGSAPRHLRYGKMRPMSSSVSRTLRALENGPKYRLPGTRRPRKKRTRGHSSFRVTSMDG